MRAPKSNGQSAATMREAMKSIPVGFWITTIAVQSQMKT